MFSKLCSLMALLSLLVFQGMRGQDTLDTAVAQKGDGIYSLLRKQGIDPYKSYDDFIVLNEGNLRDDAHLYEGREYLIPKVPLNTVPIVDSLRQQAVTPTEITVGEFPIFGEKYASVVKNTDRLKGTVYYLVSGHGGPDPGAMTKFGQTYISEDEYAYDITLRLARELISHGALVYIIIRDPDDGIRDERILKMDRDEVAYPDLSIPLNQKARLEQRVNAINTLYRKHRGQYQRLIATHVDSRSKGRNIDVFFYHHEKSSNGKRLAESIHQTFMEKYRKFQPHRVYSGTFEDRSSLYLVRNTHPPMTFIEIGNIANTKDQRRILDPDNRQALAKWISEGVLLDYGQ